MLSKVLSLGLSGVNGYEVADGMLHRHGASGVRSRRAAGRVRQGGARTRARRDQKLRLPVSGQPYHR